MINNILFFSLILAIIAISYFLGFRKGREISFLDILEVMNISMIKILPKKKKEKK